MKLPRFTLRDLFWLVLVVAMGCAWWLDHSRLSAVAARTNWQDGGVVADWMERYLEQEGYSVRWMDDGSVWITSPSGKEQKGIAPGANRRR